MDDSSFSTSLSQLAIDAALDSRWIDALKLNKKIIKFDPQNVDALARLARVYMEMGRINLARKYYGEVVKIDPYNPIALKNLKIIKSFKSNGKNNIIHNGVNGVAKLSAALFLQEPGKTKIVNLLNVAEPQRLSKTYCGMPVKMVIKNRKITIVDNEGNYLGVLPDDISHHLLRLLKGGSKYDLIIKSIRVNGLAVLIKETFRSKRFKNQSSFLESSADDVILSTEIYTCLDNQTDENSADSQEEQLV